MSTIIDGKATAQEIKEQVKKLVHVSSIQPKLVVILVGDDPASATYVRNKERACEDLGIAHETIRLSATVSQNELLEHIQTLNSEPSVHGILVQLPLPQHMSEQEILVNIDATKDVDGLHPTNIGSMVVGQKKLVPCTPAGIMYLLKKYQVELKGKEAVVVGRSNIVGKPIAFLLLEQHATVTICHSRTKDLGAVTRGADILVVAVGKPRMITGSMVKEGAVVIDVGTNWIEENGKQKWVGDVDFEEVAPKVAAISPVPGGVGPMTIAMLMSNVCRAAGLNSI